MEQRDSTAPKQAWSPPQVVDLPRLVDLTLQTGPGIPGGDTNFSMIYPEDLRP